MTMRGFAVFSLLVSLPAAADTLGGFSSVATPYLVNQDRVCEPLEVAQGVATGAPKCARAAADAIAKLAFKAGTSQRGATAQFAATAVGTELIVSRSGQVAVTWRAPDPIARVVEVTASQYGDRVAVAYATRRLGKEAIDVIAFTVVKTTGRTPDDRAAAPAAPTAPAPSPAAAAPSPATPAPSPATPAPSDPALVKRVEAARAAPKRQALAAWRSVLSQQPDHGEALYQTARLHLAAKQTGDAFAALERLARSSRGDAIEWLVEARFDPGFASVRANATYRAAVGLDRKPTSVYERLMGFGGQWEQAATCGEKPNVVLTTRRDRTFRLAVLVHCNGRRDGQTFSGTWRAGPDDAQVTLVLPPAKGAAASVNDESLCVFRKVGDEDALRCELGQDLDFELYPSRR